MPNFRQHTILNNAKDRVFKYINNNSSNTIVLIPGWASYYRIFNLLRLKFNYLMPVRFSPHTFQSNLLSAIDEFNISKVSLFGWSLGGFLATEFALEHKDKVDDVILVSVRKKYPDDKLAEISKLLKKNKKGYLYKFYSQCFSSKDQMRWFRTNLLKSYCDGFDLDYLLEGLEYLKNSHMSCQLLAKLKKIKMIHGEQDNIAPIREAFDIKDNLPNADFVCIKEAGHIPFLETDVGKYI